MWTKQLHVKVAVGAWGLLAHHALTTSASGHGAPMGRLQAGGLALNLRRSERSFHIRINGVLRE